MRNFLACSVMLASLVTVGCYNNPDISERNPGEFRGEMHKGPSVGPGRTAGGSTAGPQPPKAALTGNVIPKPGGAVDAEPGLGHATPPRPEFDQSRATPAGPASRMGNQRGGENRGPAAYKDVP